MAGFLLLPDDSRMPSKEIILAPLTHFFASLEDEMSVDDHIEFFCNHKTAEGDTFLRLETYDSTKLSRVVMEEYSIKNKMRGSVIMTFPRHDNDVPIFFFQIGGRGERSIAVLDISPTHPGIDYAPIAPVYEKYHELLGLGPSKVAWLQKICSPYLLHCQYDEIDCDLFLEAMREYLEVWLEHYYRPGTNLTDEHEIEVVTNAIYKFKYVLHHHDPAYGIFAKAWGKSAADAFVHLECSDHPAYQPPETLDGKVKPWHNDELNVAWTEKAQLLAAAVPEASRAGVRATVERRAAEHDLGIITPELYQRYSASPGAVPSA